MLLRFLRLLTSAPIREVGAEANKRAERKHLQHQPYLQTDFPLSYASRLWRLM
jgi:hypothetical protein